MRLTLHFVLLTIALWVDVVKMMSLIKKHSYFLDNGGGSNNDVADFILSKGYLPNDKELSKTNLVKYDNDFTYLLSKLSDEDLLKLLNQPKKNNFDLNDIVNLASDFKPPQDNRLIVSKPKISDDVDTFMNDKKRFKTLSEKDRDATAFFRLEDKPVDPYVTKVNSGFSYAAVQKLNNLLYSQPQDDDSDEEDQKKELLFDVLVAQLKTLCCKSNRKHDHKNNNKQKSILNQLSQDPSLKQNSRTADFLPSEHMFLIINDEIKSNSSVDELISVDPESLEINSSVLLLGPINSPLTNDQLKTVMSRISNELSKPDYVPLLKQLSEGTLTGSHVKLMKNLVTGPDTRRYIKPHRMRCSWVTNDPLYVKYHDEEWGKPEYDSIKLFELLSLEGQQAGLSWITVLKKRENYRKFFFNFDPQQITELSENDIKMYLTNSSIIRHKAKIEAIINNAECYLKISKNNEDFADFIWSFVNHKPIVNSWVNQEQVPNQTDVSTALSKSLKSRGFKFVGPTICYAFMQASGMVNDHIVNCISR